jgi:hypothetical protein
MSKAKDPAPEAAPGSPGSQPVTLRTHPGAMAGIRRARARAGLAAFALVLALSLKAHVPAPDAAGRALLAGVVAQLAAWRIAVAVWSQVVRGQLEQARAAHEARRRTQAGEAAVRAQEATERMVADTQAREARWAAAGPPQA